MVQQYTDYIVAFLSASDLSKEELEDEDEVDNDDDDYNFNPDSVSSPVHRKRKVELRILNTKKVQP